MKSEPYYCPRCLTEPGCGYHGILVFEGAEPPKCEHHTGDTEAPELVPMVPVASRKNAREK